MWHRTSRISCSFVSVEAGAKCFNLEWYWVRYVSFVFLIVLLSWFGLFLVLSPRVVNSISVRGQKRTITKNVTPTLQLAHMFHICLNFSGQIVSLEFLGLMKNASGIFYLW